jgi:RNA polymerase-associated protein CTR9
MAAQEPVEGSITIWGPGGIQTDIQFKDLADEESAEVIPDLLIDYEAECKDWTAVGREHWRCGRWKLAEDLLQRGIKCTWARWRS